jgi:hypothetical protein
MIPYLNVKPPNKGNMYVNYHTHKRHVGIGAEFITTLRKGKGIQRNQIDNIL